MTRKGGHNGQGAKKCSDLGIRLFGVQLTKGVMRKSISMGNLSHYSSNTNQASSAVEHSESGAMADGYLSDGIVQTSGNCRERRKGVPWTEEEHRLFLIGLQKLGKGDWRGIARNFVTTRTATQVASHAQKYFIRQSNFSKKKRRSSLFDILPESEANVSEDPKTDFTDMSPPLSQLSLGQGSLVSSKQFVDHTQVPVLQIPLSTVPLHSTLSSSGLTSRIMPSVQDSVSFVQNIADYTLAEAGKYQGNVVSTTGEPVNVKLSSLLPTLLPESFSFWLGLFPPPSFPQKSTIVKPIATLSSAPLTIDHPSEISELAPGMKHDASIKPSPLSLKLNQPSRSSAFHVKKSFRSSNSLSGDKLNEPISVV